MVISRNNVPALIFVKIKYRSAGNETLVPFVFLLTNAFCTTLFNRWRHHLGRATKRGLLFSQPNQDNKEIRNKGKENAEINAYL